MRKLIQLKLKILSQLILKKYKPEIIGITGSVGKTGAKEAVYAVLSSKYNVRRNVKNYNNEIGLPLTIIGSESPGKSIIGWILVFIKAIKLILIINKNYPKILILEMATDKPGDMKYLNKIAKCRIGIITRIGSSHIKYFNSIKNIAKEKSLLIKNLPQSGTAILNYDDELTLAMKELTNANILTYGLREGSKVRAREIALSLNKSINAYDLVGISFKISYENSIIPVILPNIISKSSVYSVLIGACAGIIYDVNLIAISQSIKNINMPKGRMNAIRGIKNTLIIDDSYNSSPESSMVAIDSIKDIPLRANAEKYAVLGDMLELGSYSEEWHKQVGKYLAKAGIDKLITVGERSRDIDRGALDAGMASNNIFHFSNLRQAGIFIQNRIKEGDLILVKGSQGVRMEKIVLEIMAEPLRAPELLIRQDKQWAQ